VSPRKSDEILGEWLSVAGSVPQPTRAPRGNHRQQRIRSGLPVSMAATLLAVVVIAVAIGVRPASGPSSVGASQSASASGSSPAIVESGQPSAVPSGLPSPTAPASVPVATLPASDWKSFAWSSASSAGIPFIREKSSTLKWSHGFVVSGLGPDQLYSNKDFVYRLWTSSDGVSWTEAGGVTGSGLHVAEGPNGLVAIGLSVGRPETQTVWTSADGRTWSKAGTTSGLGHMVSLAGNSNTLVAIWDHSAGTDCTLNGGFSTETSADGLHWTNVAQVAFGYSQMSAPPFATSAGGRLFAMGPAADFGISVQLAGNNCLSTAPGRGTIWWSDDGQAWHLAAGNLRGLPWAIDIAAHGLLLEGVLDSAPGGYTLARSTDGGQTWTDDQSFAPLGPICTGACPSGTGPDGYYSSNGAVIVAVKSDGSKAWISSDARTWTQIKWGGPALDVLGILALPGGVLVGDQSGVLPGDQYGAGK
jgi:hypothetical protein